MISTRELDWLAGLLEGEGYFGLRRGRDVVVEITMTDEDVIRRVHKILKFGTVDCRKLPSGKIAYHWSGLHQANAAGLMMTLLPLMGERRAAKIRHCLEEWKKKPLRKALWTHCINGHELIGDNLTTRQEGKYIKRRCVTCNMLRERKYRARDRSALICDVPQLDLLDGPTSQSA